MPFSILHRKIIMLQCKDLTKNGKERLYRMTNEQSIVKVERLTKRIGSKTLVENISFEVKKGEVVGLLGPNGAGKNDFNENDGRHDSYDRGRSLD